MSLCVAHRLHTDTTQHYLIQFLCRTSLDGIISSSYLILLQILFLKKSCLAMWCVKELWLSFASALKRVIGVGYDSRNADLCFLKKAGTQLV
jgi:hypothetical protein